MEQFPEPFEHPSAEALAQPDDIKMLWRLASHLADQSQRAAPMPIHELRRLGENGNIIMRNQLESAGDYTIPVVSVRITEAGDNEDQDTLLVLQLYEGSDRPVSHLIGDTPPENLLAAREICLDWLEGHKQADIENDVILYTAAILTAEINNEPYPQRVFVSPEGGILDFRAAIAQAISEDNIHANYTVETNIPFHSSVTGTRLHIRKLYARHSASLRERPGVTIDLIDPTSVEHITCTIFDDGGLWVCESNQYFPDPKSNYVLEQYQAKKLHAGIIEALEAEDLWPVPEEESSPQPEWRSLVANIRAIDNLIEQTDPNDSEMIACYQQNIDSGMEHLSTLFQNMYHLTNELATPDLLTPQIKSVSKRILPNTLIMRTPIFYEVDPSTATGYRPVYTRPQDDIYIHYTNLSFEDPSGESEKDVYVIGFFSPKPGVLIIRAVPLSGTAEPIRAYNATNN